MKKKLLIIMSILAVVTITACNETTVPLTNTTNETLVQNVDENNETKNNSADSDDTSNGDKTVEENTNTGNNSIVENQGNNNQTENNSNKDNTSQITKDPLGLPGNVTITTWGTDSFGDYRALECKYSEEWKDLVLSKANEKNAKLMQVMSDKDKGEFINYIALDTATIYGADANGERVLELLGDYIRIYEDEYKEQMSKPVTTPEPTAKPTQTPSKDNNTTNKDNISNKDNTSNKDDKKTYTYKSMNKKMYAKSSVNVRDLPSTDGNKVGNLSKNQEVTVTGQCNETGWYRIKLNGKEVYVASSYLVNEKVVEPTATPKPTQKPTTTPKPTQAPSQNDNNTDSGNKSDKVLIKNHEGKYVDGTKFDKDGDGKITDTDTDAMSNEEFDEYINITEGGNQNWKPGNQDGSTGNMIIQ